jgi:putative DNA primase/helicase
MPKTADIADLHAEGIDLADLVEMAELVHDEAPARLDLDGDPGTLRLVPPPPGRADWLATSDTDGTIIDMLDGRERLTDRGNAEMLRRLAGDDIRWCGAMPGEGWMLWDGARWRPDTTRRVYRLADMVADEWRRLAPAECMDIVKNTEEQKSNDRRKKLLDHANKCESATGIRNMLEVTRSREGIAVEADAWDADPYLLTTPDSTFDLRRMVKYPPRRRDLVTRETATGAATGGAVTWRAFLLRIMGGPAVPLHAPALARAMATGRVTRDDALIESTRRQDRTDVDAAYARPENAGAVELVAFLQRAAGYCLTGDTSEQCLFIAHGTGGNGKGVFLNTLKAVMGTYAQGAAVETFVDRKQGGIPNDLAALAGARLVLCSEPEEDAPLAEGLIKAVTGQDTVTARFLNREFFDYIPQFKLWMMTNHKPRVKGRDNGIWRRLRLVPFTVSIPREDQDQDLGRKLQAEHGEILVWMLDGLKAWRRDGLAPPRAVLDASNAYRREMDQAADFVDDRLQLPGQNELYPGDFVAQNKDVYAAYRDWATDNGLKPRSHKWLTQELERLGYRQDGHHGAGRRWKGMKVKASGNGE